MLDDTLVKKTAYPEEATGETLDMIDLYQELYNKIKADNPRWMTISPRGSPMVPNEYAEGWRKRWMDYAGQFATRYIFIFESAHERLHMHIVYSRKDIVKEYMFINYVRSGLPRVSDSGNPYWKLYSKDVCQPSQIRTYKGMPEYGIRYLFKDIKDTYELGIDPVIITLNRF